MFLASTFSLGTVSDTNFEEEGIDAEDQTHPEKGCASAFPERRRRKILEGYQCNYAVRLMAHSIKTSNWTRALNINLKLDQCEDATRCCKKCDDNTDDE